MKRIWKELVSVICFIGLFCILVYEHVLHMENIVIKELPYVSIILLTVVIFLWSIDKLKTYRMKMKLNQKMDTLSNQYDLLYDEGCATLLSCESMLEQLHQKLKTGELNLATYEYRYRKIADITGMVIFEYNLINHTICDSLNWHAIGDSHRFVKESIQQEFVHPQDAEIFRAYFTQPPIVNMVSEINIRIRTKSNPTYYHTKIRGIALQGLNGEAEKIIGTRITQEKA